MRDMERGAVPIFPKETATTLTKGHKTHVTLSAFTDPVESRIVGKLPEVLTLHTDQE